MTSTVEPASFRDPNGYIYYKQNTLYRRVEHSYRQHYDRLMSSGLYKALVDSDLLIPHSEENADFGTADGPDAYRTLRPERVPFISYPYEWCFSQLRDAALTTLRIQNESLRHGMWLKDASAYNIQFRQNKPVLIDTLSFEEYEEGLPWPAYRQFCQHFLAPLALMSRTDVRLGQLLRTYIDGIPLDLAATLLPKSSRFNLGLLTHIHIHGAAQKRYEGKPVKGSDQQARVGKTALLGLIDNLEGAVKKLTWTPAGTTWADYYSETNYSDRAMSAKKALVTEMLGRVEPQPATVWDLGANTGAFSRLAAEIGANTIAWDIDPGAVEKNYLECRSTGETKILPLVEDLTNPSPGLGWALQERKSLVERGPADVIMALALVHHLAIGNNVPLDRIAAFFRLLGTWLIVEFVPKSDSQVQRLLASRDDIFPGYQQDSFEVTFQSGFDIIRSARVPDSERTLYLMRRREVDA